jgi:hypothetical protein
MTSQGLHVSGRSALEHDEIGLLREILSHRPVSSPAQSSSEYSASTTSGIDETKQMSSMIHGIDLRQVLGNARKTFELLGPLVSQHRDGQDVHELQDFLVNLPDNTFSEVLRSLDAVSVVSRELDPALDVPIGSGLAQQTELGSLVDEFGVRHVYSRLLQRVLAAVQLRLESGHTLALSDYKILLRCAGAASDLQTAKRIWQLMEQNNQTSLRDGEAHDEFIKARFLTEPLYTQFDMARFRVRPADLHHQKIWLLPRRLERIQKIARNMALHQGLRFGQNRYAPEQAESLMRILRKTKPIRNVFIKTVRSGVVVDEKLLCSAMVAFARNGSLQFIKQLILRRYWKIQVVPATEDGEEVKIVGATSMYRPDSPMYPSSRLLLAVVESFGCNAEINTALKLVEFISKQYNIAIPDQVWFRLLEWTYVQSSKPASTEWKHAKFPDKMIHPSMVQHIWDTMVSEPYNVQPGFTEHMIMIKSLLGRNRLKDALQWMLELQPVFKAALTELEDAYLEHRLLTQLRVDTDKSLQRLQRARVQKHAMWFAMQTCSYRLLKQIRSNRIDDVMTTRLVPQLIDAFRQFLGRPMRYRIATGHIELRKPPLKEAKGLEERDNARINMAQ